MLPGLHCYLIPTKTLLPMSLILGQASCLSSSVICYRFPLMVFPPGDLKTGVCTCKNVGHCWGVLGNTMAPQEHLGCHCSDHSTLSFPQRSCIEMRRILHSLLSHLQRHLMHRLLELLCPFCHAILF
ncbi:uncharacterized protein BT62DRAFT_541367 [Guyanagaster necrorhizus]|uniref:Uncharacterized protein n=1 Tax=Guyanagaster necrorhizus TaxID=856835 RepID=A0A9P7W2P1_9AGAR|nr:uncharacterized protein BT62DRAFT_541367 [Guyanagaster necrorhizus MCA 3950]KAG7450870.1 hypothetical protein BT62DRAFT_541367 [Guyanagaster necrorhizus MCA 3950]